MNNEILLKKIYDILDERLEKKPPFYKRYSTIIWVFTLSLSLFFIDFQNLNKKDADLFVYNKESVELVKFTKDDFNVHIPEKYLSIPSLPENTDITSIFKFTLEIQGLMYFNQPIRAKKVLNKTIIDIAGKPIIRNQTRLTIESFKFADKALVSAILRSHGLKVGDQIIPLLNFIKTPLNRGFLVIKIKPRVGMERFKSNLTLFLGLLN